MNKRSEPRRGVILLVVLGLLTLFALMTMTFILVAAQARRTAQATTEAEQYGDPPQTLLDEAALQVLRGTNNPLSVLRPHSLLEDIYGNSSATGEVESYQGPGTGTFDGLVTFDESQHLPSPDADRADALDLASRHWHRGGLMFGLDIPLEGLDGAAGTADDAFGFFNGRVLTMLSGRAAGQSTRIVGYEEVMAVDHDAIGYPRNVPARRLWLMPFPSMRPFREGASGPVVWDVAGAPAPGDQFIINGRPFSGTGFGFKTESFDSTIAAIKTGMLDASLRGPLDPKTLTMEPENWEYALLPNSVFFEGNTALALPYIDPAGPGGANEDYDAPDFQNMLLAMKISTDQTASPYFPSAVVLPSLHRPDLMNYWYQRLYDDVSFMPTLSGLPRWQAILRPDLFTGTQTPAEKNRIVALKRKISMRPLPEDHPNFTGSNPAIVDNPIIEDDGSGNPVDFDFDGDGFKERLQALHGPWDVDNDGDGKPDSVWVDLGFPAQTTADGRQYKPLFAILCVDLDGKLNINAHGRPLTPWETLDGPDRQPSFVRVEGPLAGMSTNQSIAVGSGYSPAEINLSLDDGTRWTLFRGNSAPLASGLSEYAQVLHGLPSTTSPVQGRYGELHRLTGGGALLSSSAPMPGARGYDGNYPLEPVASVQMSGNVFHALRGNVVRYDAGGLYVSPPDLDGDGALALNLRGQPLFGPSTEATHPMFPTDFGGVARDQLGWGGNASGITGWVNWATGATNMGEQNGSEAINDPTEIDLSNSAQGSIDAGIIGLTAGQTVDVDAPFSVADLEWILRSHDIDGSALPDRIKQLAPYFANDRFRRSLATTESWDLPSPSFLPTPELREAALAVAPPGGLVSPVRLTGMHITDMLRAKLIDEGVTNVDDRMRELLPPDLLAGLKFNINQPFGNGRDDDPPTAMGYGVVDEPAEAPTESLWLNSLFDSMGFSFDNNRDGEINADDEGAREKYARYLYVLLMLLKDGSYLHAVSDDPSALTAHRLAQWAVNVVDFRDPDSIMTRFNYDPMPFDTDFTLPKDTVVWGCERPELLITETLAFHDTRTKDTDEDSTDEFSPTDPDYDQVRRPQGSLFIELYNPSNPDDPRSYPAEFYRQIDPTTSVARNEFHTGGDQNSVVGTGAIPNGALDLGKLAPASGANRYPVWQLAIAPMPPNTTIESDLFSFDPENPNVVPTGAPLPTMNIERRVWFTTPTLYGGPVPASDIFYAELDPGSTDPENEAWANGTTDPDAYKMFLVPPGRYAVIGPRVTTKIWGSGSPQHQIQLFTSTLDPNGPVPPAKLVSDNLNVVYPAWPNQIKRPVGIVINEPDPLSISEPIGGYPATTGTTSDPDDGTIQYNDAYTTPLDNPLDLALIGGDVNPRTEPEYKAVYLQRLANPLEPWDDVTNPYITVDWMPIDLTIFNSEDNLLNYVATPPAGGGVSFEARQRNGNGEHNLWAQPSSDPTLNPLDQLVHTLGFLNGFYNGGARPNEFFADPAVGLPLSDADPDVLPTYYGDPRRPFPWLAWNNRPFVSEFELLQVPRSSPGRFLHELTLHTSGADHFVESSDTAPFDHLLNFWHTSVNSNAPNYHRIFEFLHVPSRFSGTKDLLDPRIVSDTALMPTNHEFHPPFNYVSRYREPGRVNINTVFDEGTTLRAMLNGLDEADTTWTTGQLWRRVLRSRKGYPDQPVQAYSDPLQMFDPKPTSPTILANVFRSPLAEHLVPVEALRRDDADPSSPKRDPAESGMLRPDPGIPGRPLFAPEFTEDFRNTDRNSYFRYQGLQKLGNLVTTRSNVYAVWITVGYFEVEQGPVDAGHPDGYRLGRELGIETGEVERHRAFYVFDRTVPVGFERGKDHNVQRAMRLRRFIE